MIYLHMIVEGKTERYFGEKILAPYLGFLYCIDVSIIETSRDRSQGRVFKGGLGNYEKVKREITNRIKQYSKYENHFFSTMFDFYALHDSFPGYPEAERIVDPYDKLKILEESFAKDINNPRFIPYIQLHEFESMIFVDPGQLIFLHPESENGIAILKNVLKEKRVKDNPELIDDGQTTAPSKRILAQIHEYHKPSGFITVEKIGIETIRKKCPHFNEWLEKLEQLKTN